MYLETRELDIIARRIASESAEILSNPDQLYDLVSQRLAQWAYRMEQHLLNNSIRIGIIGNPNRGKTTLSYTMHKLFEAYGLNTHYVDLDIYSNSGPAISGEIKWENRKKRSRVTKNKINESLSTYTQYSSGITLADFPGKITNKYQKARLEITDLAIILVGKELNTELQQWNTLTTKAEVLSVWMQSRLDKTLLQSPIYPSVRDLKREVNPFHIPTMIFATGILREIAYVKKLNIPEEGQFYSQAERVILEEVLDFLFAPPKTYGL